MNIFKCIIYIFYNENSQNLQEIKHFNFLIKMVNFSTACKKTTKCKERFNGFYKFINK